MIGIRPSLSTRPELGAKRIRGLGSELEPHGRGSSQVEWAPEMTLHRIILLYGALFTATLPCSEAVGWTNPLETGLIRTALKWTEKPFQPQQDVSTEPESVEGYSEELGLRYPTGPGIAARTIRANGQVILELQDTSTPPKWKISLQKTQVAQLGETTHLTNRHTSAGPEVSKRPTPLLMERSTLKIRVMGWPESQGFPAELMYLNVPLDGDRTGRQWPFDHQTGFRTFSTGRSLPKASPSTPPSNRC